MENSLKQRIVGAIVLVALGVIFLPSILKEKTSNGIFESKIPKKPRVITDYKMDTFKIDELLAEEDIVAKNIQKKAEKARLQIDEKVDEPIIKEQPVKSNDENLQNIDNESDKAIDTGAWIIQVASFSKQYNAVKLVNKLKVNGHKAYKSRVAIDKNIVYRVFVGPFIKKINATADILDIDKVSGTKGMLKVFNPIKH